MGLEKHNRGGPHFKGYAKRAWSVFQRDAWIWAKEHIGWDVFFLIAPPVVMLIVYHLKPDYRVLFVTLAVYLAVFFVYCAVQVVQIPAKLDRERMGLVAERDSEIVNLKAAASRTEITTTVPFLGLLRERQRLESELQPLLEIEESGIKVVQVLKVGKDESDFRQEKIEQLRRDIAAIKSQIDNVQPKPLSTLPADWKDLADRFAASSQFVRADWQRGGMRKNGDEAIERWRFAGDVNGEKNLEPLCRLAGKLLSRSPNSLSKVSKQTLAETDDVRRWFYFLKERGAMARDGDYGHVEGSGELIFLGSIGNVADASRIACLDCAAEES